MYRTITNSLQTALNGLELELPVLLSKGSSTVIRHIKREIEMFFEHNSTHGLRTAPRKVISPNKVKLQDSLDTAIENLMKAWSEDVEFEAEEVNDRDDVEFEADNRFGIGAGTRDNDEDDEDYDFLGSDGDD
jgi:hypothetical protein